MKARLRPDIGRHAKRVHSQNGEDGIVEAIFQCLAPRSKFFVEFGVGPNADGHLEGNCVNLVNSGWRGVLLDKEPFMEGIQKEFITPLNVNSLFRKYGVPRDVDIVSIDIDGQDFWVWLALNYEPLLYIVEYNCNFADLNVAKTIHYDTAFQWDHSKYYGASLGALLKLGRDKGYTLVHANTVNAFFVLTDAISNVEDFVAEKINRAANMHVEAKQSKPWIDV